MILRVLAASVLAVLPLATLAAPPPATAVLKNADGKEVGTATLTPAKDGVKVHLKAANLPPGKHGIHIHAMAKCEPPDFKSAGGHFNPAGKKHGLKSKEGSHAGDLPNLVVAKNGKATSTFTAKHATLAEGEGSLFGADGTAIVIHADPDDEKTDPAGNSGARIACGVIERK